MNYKLSGSGVIRLSDGAFIPFDPGNSDYQAFIASGEVPQPADPPPVANHVDPLDWFLRLSQATQSALDVAARTDTAVSLALRYASGVIFIDVADPRTIASVNLLRSKNLLTDQEVTTLLTP